jgi:hypothetical protein
MFEVCNELVEISVDNSMYNLLYDVVYVGTCMLSVMSWWRLAWTAACTTCCMM